MSFCHLQGCRICSTIVAGQEEMSGGRHKAERVIILPFYLLIRKHAMQRSVKVILRNSGSNILFPELPSTYSIFVGVGARRSPHCSPSLDPDHSFRLFQTCATGSPSFANMQCCVPFCLKGGKEHKSVQNMTE